MLDNLKLSDVLFLDIETGPAAAEFGELNESFQ